MLFLGTGSLSPYWATESRQGVPPHHQKLVRTRNVRQGVHETRPGQGRAAVYEGKGYDQSGTSILASP